MLVEGVHYEMDWPRLRKTTAVFIPCLNPVSAKRQVMVVANRLGIKLIFKVVIVDGVRGLRVWKA